MPSPKKNSNIKSRRLAILLALFLLWSFHQNGPVMAQNTTDNKNTAPEQEVPIEITADRLITNSEKKYADFIGNVRASQGSFVITSGKLRIYYERDLLGSNSKASDSKKSDSGQDALKKIIATGNVKIVSEQYTATSDRAEYDVVDGTIILSGEESTVISGKNSLSGTKIIMNQESGEVKVEGGPKKRVKAVFYSEGGAENPFQIGKPQGGKKE